jgi:acyl transferase domain-containing protein
MAAVDERGRACWNALSADGNRLARLHGTLRSAPRRRYSRRYRERCMARDGCEAAAGLPACAGTDLKVGTTCG